MSCVFCLPILSDPNDQNDLLPRHIILQKLTHENLNDSPLSRIAPSFEKFNSQGLESVETCIEIPL